MRQFLVTGRQGLSRALQELPSKDFKAGIHGRRECNQGREAEKVHNQKKEELLICQNVQTPVNIIITERAILLSRLDRTHADSTPVIFFYMPSFIFPYYEVDFIMAFLAEQNYVLWAILATFTLRHDMMLGDASIITTFYTYTFYRKLFIYKRINNYHAG